MLDVNQIRDLGICDWAEIAKSFNNSDLLLGNGFSLNFDKCFRYESIFKEFINYCPEPHKAKFMKLKTHNFERIVEKIRFAEEINEAFGIECGVFSESIEILKEGLIKTIHQIHPRAEEIYWPILKVAANKLRQFNNIFTLNYDLFLYHIVMIMKDEYDTKKSKRSNKEMTILSRYSDCFWKPYNDSFNLIGYFQDTERFKFIYYLHGALFLFEDGIDAIKIIRNPSVDIQLVDIIGKVIKTGMLPLFVSEGTSMNKLNMINSNSYLKFALNSLDRSKKDFTIYGVSLSENDRHIIDKIDKENRKIAIAIHVGEKTQNQLEMEIITMGNKFSKCTVYYFDSRSLFQFQP